MVSLLIFIFIFVLFGLAGNVLGGLIGESCLDSVRRESLSIGIGMMPIMSVALIVVSTGIDRGIFGDSGRGIS